MYSSLTSDQTMLHFQWNLQFLYYKWHRGVHLFTLLDTSLPTLILDGNAPGPIQVWNNGVLQKIPIKYTSLFPFRNPFQKKLNSISFQLIKKMKIHLIIGHLLLLSIQNYNEFSNYYTSILLQKYYNVLKTKLFFRENNEREIKRKLIWPFSY